MYVGFQLWSVLIVFTARQHILDSFSPRNVYPLDARLSLHCCDVVTVTARVDGVDIKFALL